MPPDQANSDATSWALEDVPIFATGEIDGENWSESDLDEIIANFETYKSDHLFDPALVIGHDEEQDVLKQSGLLAGGWVESLGKTWSDQHQQWQLTANFGDVADEVVDLLGKKRLRKLSAEIFDSPELAGLSGSGKMLRRVSLLGGVPPRVKTLGDVPMPVRRPLKTSPKQVRVYCERFKFSGQHRKRGEGRTHIFSEVHMMDSREGMLAYLNGLDDASLAQMVTAAKGSVVNGGSFPGVSINDDGVNPMDDEGMTSADMSTMSDTTLCAESATPEAGKAPIVEPLSPKPGADALTTITLKHFSELDKRYKVLNANIAALEKQTAARLKMERQAVKDQHKQNVHAFCEQLKMEGRVLPYEVDPTSPQENLYHQLLFADPVNKVRKFSEGGKEISITPYESLKRYLLAKPKDQIIHRFSEQVKSPANPQDALSPEERARALSRTDHGKLILEREKAAKK